jgi:hypothetical protein
MKRMRVPMLLGTAAVAVVASLATVAPASAQSFPREMWVAGTGADICLTETGTTQGASVEGEPCQAGDTAQIWVNATTSGTFALENAQSRLCMDAFSHTAAAGVPIEVRDCEGDTNQTWTLLDSRSTGGGLIFESNIAHSTGLCIGNAGSQGVQLRLGTCENTPSQFWSPVSS